MVLRPFLNFNDGVSPTHRGLLSHTTDVHPLASTLTTGGGEPGLPPKTNLQSIRPDRGGSRTQRVNLFLGPVSYVVQAISS